MQTTSRQRSHDLNDVIGTPSYAQHVQSQQLQALSLDKTILEMEQFNTQSLKVYDTNRVVSSKMPGTFTRIEDQHLLSAFLDHPMGVSVQHQINASKVIRDFEWIVGQQQFPPV
tara:strand:- start:277 stop:618 length:342 start_codon:yes stop_codon:yes gene_type:complete